MPLIVFQSPSPMLIMTLFSLNRTELCERQT